MHDQLKEKDSIMSVDIYELFPDEESCKKFVIKQRWGGKPVCPYCNSAKAYYITGKMDFKCHECKKKYSVKTDTVMANSKLPIRVWLLAAHIMVTNKNKITMSDLAEQLKISKRTAHQLVRKIQMVCDSPLETTELK